MIPGKKKESRINDAARVQMMREADKSRIQKYKENDQHLYLLNQFIRWLPLTWKSLLSTE